MSALSFPISFASASKKGDTSLRGCRRSTARSGSLMTKSATQATSPVCGRTSEAAVSGRDPK